MLEQIAKKIEYTGSVKEYQYKKTFETDGRIYECKPMCRLSFYSKNICEELSKKGCCYHKNSIGKFIKDGIIPNELFNHYVRGLMDGNGGISYWVDNENTGHKKFQINYCGTTDIVNKLSQYFSVNFNCCPAISDRYPDRDNNNLQFNICGNVIVENILDWLYKDSNIYLKRKYEKYLILKEERKRIKLNKDKLYGNAYTPKKVIHLTDNKEYTSMGKASKDTGISASSICIDCKGKNKNWMYLDDYIKMNIK